MSRVRRSLAAAHRRLHGVAAPAALLDILTAHVAHETGRGERMFNFNFGGMKGKGPSGLTARYKTTEFFDGSKKSIVDGFRAYKTLDEGALDYLQLMDRRFGAALERAATGDVDGFTEKLKQSRYFTAPLEAYNKAMHAHLREGTWNRGKNYDQIKQGGRYLYGAELSSEGMRLEGDGLGLPTRIEVARVLGAMSSLTARIASPNDPSQDPSDQA